MANELYGFKKNLEKVQVRSKSESAAKSHLVPTLITNIPLAAPATQNEYASRTIAELANWNVVVLCCKCQNVTQNIVYFRGVNIHNYLVDTLTSTKTRGEYYVDWTNNRIKVAWLECNPLVGGLFVQIMGVYGLVQNVDVVDIDTEDEPSGDDGEDIDISGLTEEVQGIRIGADGTIYETAGQAVREQYIALAQKLDVLDVTKTAQEMTELINGVNAAVDTAIAQIEEAGGLILDPTLTQSGQAADAKVVGDAIDALGTTENETQTVDIPVTWTSGYMVQNGMTYSNSSYVYSNHIPVSQGDVVRVYRESDGAIITGLLRYVTAFSNGSADSSKGSENTNVPYTVPSGVNEIVISIASAYGNATADKVVTLSTIIPKEKPAVDNLYDIVANKKPNSFVYNFDISAGQTHTENDELEDLCAYRICFICKITSITGVVRIEKGITNSYGGGFGFDGTNLYQYINGSTNPAITQAHGLTLKDYVSIVLDASYTTKATLTISTNGGSYTRELTYWRSHLGSLAVYSQSDTLTDCELSYTCEGLIKDTWIFGDSYLNNGSNNRWAYYLVNSGHHNYLLNGFSGRNSAQALASLKVDLSFNRTPKRILWLLGMNDKDGDSDPNANWLASIEEVIEICEEKHIELILATIPNVPSTSTKNTLKNAHVVASGYRYIDFANAISADGSSTWYDNMLNSDNVHPDPQGALALYNCAVTTVPELLF